MLQQIFKLQIETLDEIDSIIYKIDYRLKKFRKVEETSATNESSPAAHSSAVFTQNTSYGGGDQMRLPRVDLPSFTGAYTDWNAFWDVFDAAVHQNTSLNDSQKFNYLKLSLKDEPFRLVAALPVTNSSYDQARRILQKRYENMRAISEAHARALISYPSIKIEDCVQLRKLQASVQEHVLAMQALGVKVEYHDLLFVCLIADKLDSETKRQWELSATDNKIRTLDQLLQFIDRQARALEASPSQPKIQLRTQTSHNNNTYNRNDQQNRVTAFHGVTNIAYCPGCNGTDHILSQCQMFLEVDANARFNMVKNAKLCFNCLRSGHIKAACYSKHKCRECGQLHHTLLHGMNNQENETRTHEMNTDKMEALHACSSQFLPPGNLQAVLSTARIGVLDKERKCHYFRALLDNGSTVSIISQNCLQKLGLQTKQDAVTIHTVGDNQSDKVRPTVGCTLRCGQVDIPSSMLVMEKVTTHIPQEKIDVRHWKSLSNVKLADPDFATPGRVDILLGADVYECIVSTNRQRLYDRLFLRETLLGWIVCGAIERSPRDAATCGLVSSLQQKALPGARFKFKRKTETDIERSSRPAVCSATQSTRQHTGVNIL